MSQVQEPLVTLEQVDVDGALQETAEKAYGRSDFLRKVALGGTGVVGGSMLLGAFNQEARAAGSPQGDVDIANFALTLEELEAAFYVEAVRRAGLSGRLLSLSQTVRNHEIAHVRFLRRVLGSAAIAKPRFNFRGTTTNRSRFHQTAITVEDLGVSAYAGQVTNINQAQILAAAASIHSVEARHAAAFRYLAGQNPAPRAFDGARSKTQVLAAVGGTRFIV